MSTDPVASIRVESSFPMPQSDRLAALLLLGILFPLPAAAQGTVAVAARFGHWDAPFTHDLTGFGPGAVPFEAVHLALIPRGSQRGKVLAWDLVGPQPSAARDQRWSIVDARAEPPLFRNSELTLPAGAGDFFCAGHAWTSDGRLLVAGGTEEYPDRDDHDHDFITGGRLLYLYDPGFGELGRWTRQLDLAVDRWYPTVLATGSGELIVAGGLDTPDRPLHTTYELFPGDRAGSPGRGRRATRTLFAGPGGLAAEFEVYPRMHLLRSGELFVVGFDGASARGNHALAPGTWTAMDTPEHAVRNEYCSLLLPVPFDAPEVVLTIGGAVPDLAGVRRPVRAVEACRPGAAGAPAWDWQPFPRLNIARSHHNAVILPTRAVLVFGGRTSASGEPEQGTLVPELFDGRRWRVLAPAASLRAYHATALLLPDASVLTAGGDHRTHDYQVFHPPYPFDAHPRPVLTAAPPVLGYSAASSAWHTLTFTLAPGETFGHAALVAPGSVTHSTDFSQRYVELESASPGATSVQVRGPLDANHAPPGHYMLFLVSAAGSPSVASWVEVR